MIDVNQLRKGTTYLDGDDLLKVLTYAHNKTARGAGNVRVTIRNLRTGATVEKTYPTGSKVQDVRLEAVNMEYLYEDGEFLTSIDGFEYMDTVNAVLPAGNYSIMVTLPAGTPVPGLELGPVDIPAGANLTILAKLDSNKNPILEVRNRMK